MNNHSNEGRIAHIEGTVERIVVEVADLKLDLRETRESINDHRRETRQDFRFLIGLQLTTTLALIGVMAKGFGWL